MDENQTTHERWAVAIEERRRFELDIETARREMEVIQSLCRGPVVPEGMSIIKEHYNLMRASLDRAGMYVGVATSAP